MKASQLSSDLLPDLCDNFRESVQVLSFFWSHYGKINNFFGEVVTIDCFEDNSKVREILQTSGQGKVLVVDGKGSLNFSLLGDNLAQFAIDNAWEGIVIYGCIRDVATINAMPISVKALGSHPMKTEKRNQGEINKIIIIDGISIYPGDYIYADLNGVLVSKTSLLAENK